MPITYRPRTQTNTEYQAMNATETPAPITATTTKLELVFLGADGFPIDGLKGRVIVDGEEKPFQTDAQGTTETVHAMPESKVQVHVMRMDGSFKELQSCEAGHADTCWSFISPSVVMEVTTEPHRGEPGTVAQEIPVWESGDAGERDKGQEAIAGAAPFEEGFEPTQVVIQDTPIAAQKPIPAMPAKVARSQPTKTAIPEPSKAKATEAAKATLNIGRDAHGNPLAVLTQKVKDWWGAWHLPTWSLSWGAQASTVTSSQSAAPAAGTPLSNAQLETAQKQIKRLIEFAKKQATYDYSKTSTSASIITSLKNNTFKEPASTKPPHVGWGRCYKHVKIALAYAGIVEGVVADGASIFEQEAARLAGPFLIAKGFRDVTDEVQDPRWAAAGDVITYDWSDSAWDARKKQPQHGANYPHYGHIDIRDYETYVSDFTPPPQTNHPTWVRNVRTPNFYLEYVNIKIFRKVYDPTPVLNMKAFLRCLQYCETFGSDPSKIYKTNRGYKPFTYFEGFKFHPAHSMVAGAERDNTPAGAYQIIYKTWKDIIDQNILELKPGSDAFSPGVQDRIAVVLIEERNALHLVRTAQLDAAVHALLSIWVSLPGGSQNVPERSMTKFKSNFEQFFVEEKIKVGLV
jgi:muramidase (phage lysozyme)